jgi:hypothetical protein
MKSLKWIVFISLPLTVIAYFIVGYSWFWTIFLGLVFVGAVIAYDHYLWAHSWLMIGNQKVTLSIRNGIFSQYAMNIRYRNIRDSAVSKNSMFGFLLKYGTLFIRSSTADGDFQANFVPKVGKIYALVNALSRYSDDERASIDTIEKLHNHHQKNEFAPTVTHHPSLLDSNLENVALMIGVRSVVVLSDDARDYLISHEEERNIWVHQVLQRKHILILLHDASFRSAHGSLTAHKDSGVVFPPIPFPEVEWRGVISASPGVICHEYLLQFFPYRESLDATVIVGWDD